MEIKFNYYSGRIKIDYTGEKMALRLESLELGKKKHTTKQQQQKNQQAFNIIIYK